MGENVFDCSSLFVLEVFMTQRWPLVQILTDFCQNAGDLQKKSRQPPYHHCKEYSCDNMQFCYIIAKFLCLTIVVMLTVYSQQVDFCCVFRDDLPGEELLSRRGGVVGSPV